jgi:hypothetical protein
MVVVGAELAEQVGGGLVGDAGAGAERIAVDGPPVLGLVLGGVPPGEREQGLVLVRGRPSWRGRLAITAVLGGGRPPRAVDGARSIMETATRHAAGWTAAVIQPQAVGSAWTRLAARLSRTPPSSTTVGHDSRRAVMPSCSSGYGGRGGADCGRADPGTSAGRVYLLLTCRDGTRPGGLYLPAALRVGGVGAGGNLDLSGDGAAAAMP